MFRGWCKFLGSFLHYGCLLAGQMGPSSVAFLVLSSVYLLLFVSAARGGSADRAIRFVTALLDFTLCSFLPYASWTFRPVHRYRTIANIHGSPLYSRNRRIGLGDHVSRMQQPLPAGAFFGGLWL